MSGYPQDSNPYAPSSFIPPSHEKSGSASSREESIRRKHLSHEASIKSFGFLYLLGGVIGVLLGIGYVAGGIGMLVNPQQELAGAGAFLLVLGVFVSAMSVFQFVVGLGLRKIQSWARIAGIVLSCIGLIGFPIGTLISGYFLYLVLSAKGQYIFSDPYRQVMAETPHIKYKTSIIVWIFLGLLVGLFLLGLVGLMIG